MKGHGPEIALITGAASGIGKAAAIQLAAMGRAVCVTDLCLKSAERTVGEIRALGGAAFARAADLRQAEQIGRLLEDCASQGRISAIVHSAGLFPQLSFQADSLRDLDDVMAVNFRAAYLLAKGAAPRMQGGALVFLTSGAGLMSAIDDPFQRSFSLYGASKAALDRWALGIAAELADLGLALSTITPGALVETTGTALIDRSAMRNAETVSADVVGRAIAWLAFTPRVELAGKRLNACDFGKSWGETT